MRMRCFWAGVLCLAGIYGFAMVSGAEENPSLEQVYVNMPEVTVYGKGIGEDVAEAWLGKDKLEFVGCTSFAESGEPVYYYVLLDVSNSMPEAYFDEIKQSIRNFEGTLRPDDRMALYTFGEQVELRLSEEHTPEDTQVALDTIDNVDNKTLLFEAISMAADRAEQVPPQMCRRRVLVVISDGEDFTVGKTVAQEAQENLRRKGIPAYACAIKDTARENINNFGEFARTSGGQLMIFGREEAGTFLDTFVEDMGMAEVMEFQAASNAASNSMETFSVRTGANQTFTRDVLVSRHKEDRTAPKILYAKKVAGNQIRLEFSEPVHGAGAAGSYMVTRGKGDAEGGSDIVAVTGVSVDTENPNQVVLTFAGELKPGKYTIACTNIYDLSMESNPVEDTAGFEVEEPTPVLEVVEPTMAEKLLAVLKKWFWVPLLVLAGTVAAGAVVAARRKKEKEVRPFERLEEPDPETAAIGGPAVSLELEEDDDCTRRLFDYPETGLRSYRLEFFDMDNPEQVYQANVEERITIGRSRECMVCIPDNRTMSGCHCEIVLRDGKLILRDMGSRNGTFLDENPNRVAEAELKPGSILRMGSARLKVQVREIRG